MTKTNWRHGVRVNGAGKSRYFGKNYSIPLQGFSFLVGRTNGKQDSSQITDEEREEDTEREQESLPRSYSGDFDCSGLVTHALWGIGTPDSP